jgi:hypothetical protein
MTKSTWRKSDGPSRRNMACGFLCFVVGIGIAAYCGYSNRHADAPASGFLTLVGWALLLIGLVWFILGLLQGPIRRR